MGWYIDANMALVLTSEKSSAPSPPYTHCIICKYNKSLTYIRIINLISTWKQRHIRGATTHVAVSDGGIDYDARDAKHKENKHEHEQQSSAHREVVLGLDSEARHSQTHCCGNRHGDEHNSCVVETTYTHTCARYRWASPCQPHVTRQYLHDNNTQPLFLPANCGHHVGKR